jgi:transposase
MKLHGNARTCPNSRRLLIERVIEEDWSVSAAAAAAGISERTVYRWPPRSPGRAGLDANGAGQLGGRRAVPSSSSKDGRGDWCPMWAARR